jgi:FKBP-type peptidyl-prolyl cis-trans isomerase 2
MQKGDFIRINYIGSLESGEIFDLTDEELAKKEKIYNERIKYGPIPIVIGAGFVIPGLDRALLEMGVGEKRSVSIEPKDAFGERDAQLVKTVPQKMFKDQKVEPKQGLIVDFGGMKGRIQSVSGGRVRVDFNNPLAGKTLKYEIEITEKIDEPVKQIKGVFEFFGIYNADVKIENNEAVIAVAAPHELRQKLSQIILDNVKGVTKVTYQESYTKKDEKKEEKKEE